MAVDWSGLIDALASHALTLGVFGRVNRHEPKSAPGKGLNAAIWVQGLGPAPGGSGLAATSVRAEFAVRVFQDMLSDPQDAIDPAVLTAVDALMSAYSSAFTLSLASTVDVRMIDLLGAYGEPLRAQAGYLNQDNRLYRVMTVFVPLIINDVWTQGA